MTQKVTLPKEKQTIEVQYQTQEETPFTQIVPKTPKQPEEAKTEVQEPTPIKEASVSLKPEVPVQAKKQGGGLFSCLCPSAQNDDMGRAMPENLKIQRNNNN